MTTEPEYYRNDKGLICGKLVGNRYLKLVRESQHLFKMMDAWAIDTAIIDDIKKKGVDEIHVLDSEHKKMYRAPMQAFDEHGVTRNFGTEQRFLSRKYFTVENVTDDYYRSKKSA